MAISLAALLGVPSLKLAKAGLAETTWHQDIVWVAVTEQEDPQRFLNGGELVLTTGMRLKSAPEQRRFVRQVQRAGAVGVGTPEYRRPCGIAAQSSQSGMSPTTPSPVSVTT